MNLVHILNIGRNIRTCLIDNAFLNSNLLFNMIAVGKVSMNIDFQKNEVMPFLRYLVAYYSNIKLEFRLLIFELIKGN